MISISRLYVKFAFSNNNNNNNKINVVRVISGHHMYVTVMNTPVNIRVLVKCGQSFWLAGNCWLLKKGSDP